MEMKKLSEEEVESLPKDIIIKLFMSMQSSVESLEATIKLLSEQIKLMNQRSFGRSTEKQSSGIFEQLELGFNEPEVLFDLLQPEPTLEEAAPRKKAKGKRASDIRKITNHREEYIELSEEELNERFGKSGWKRLPYQIITKLEHIPASFEAVTYKIGVYAAKDNQTIIRAQKPVELWPNSIATPSLVSSIIWGKYVNAVPLYRQEKTYQENQINISRSTMANWMIQASDNYLIHFYDRLKEEMIKQDILHADETPFEVSKDGRKAGSKSYMWVYRTGAHEEEKRIVLYDYRSTRSHEHPQRFLEGFRGTLVCDGYSAYHQLAKEDPESFTVAGCWTHLKRKFTTLIKAVKTSQTLAQEAVDRINRIYHEDNKLKGLGEQEKLKQRKEKVAPLVDEFFTWVKRYRENVSRESETGKGFTYALNQESYLRAFLKDARIPLDNNAAERAIRPFTVGRKNWIMIDTIKGAQASAVLYSIVETCKANDIKIYEYIRYLLEELPKTIHDLTVEVPDRLLPWSKELPDNIYKNRT